MKGKFWTLVSLFVAISMVLTACAPAATPTPAARKLKITVATDATWPPFEYVDEETKEIVGFDIELMNAIAKSADFEVEFINVGWDPLLAGMATGHYAAISAMTITEERKKSWDFSDPYYNAGQLIGVQIDNETIKGPADLSGKVVGAQIGTTGAMEVEKIAGATLKTYDEIPQAMLDLINGQIDAVVADNPLVAGYVGKYPTKIKSVGEPFTEEYYGIAVKKGAPEVLEAINKGLKAVMDQGLIAQLDAKWCRAAPEPKKVKVGLVTDVGKVNDGTFNEFAYKGMMMAVEEFGLESAFIETLAPTDYEKNIEQFAQEGYEMIITVGFMIGDATIAVANKYPDINLAGVDQSQAEVVPNVAGLIFSEDQAGFLAGCLAGLMTKSNVVGIVAGMEIPPVIKYRKGYENGAHYVNPDCKVLGVYIDSFVDPARGKEAALSQIAEGADVIFGAGGPTGSGGILGAAQHGVYVIGVDQDEYLTTFGNGSVDGSDKLLSSAMKRVDVSVYTAISNAVWDTWQGGNLLFEAANDGVGLAPFHETEGAVPAEVKAKLEEIAKGMKEGTIETGVVL